MAESPIIQIVREGNERRGVGLLIIGRPEEAAVQKHIERKGIQTAFDYWIMGYNNPSRWHGWDSDKFHGKYTKCIVFKDTPHRIYGFRCHPKKQDIRYEFSILVIHATKHTDKTDEKMLIACENMNCNTEVHMAARRLFEKPTPRG